MKGITLFLFLVGAMLFSCEKQDDLSIPRTSPEKVGTKSIRFSLDEKSLNSSVALSIEDFEVYVYLKDSLVASNSGKLSANNDWQVEVPLDEQLQLLAVANAASVSDTDSLSKVTVLEDDQCKNEVFLSGITSFVSDNSGNMLSVELNRGVGQVLFNPVEDESELQNITDFDTLDVVFNNVVVGFKPGTNETILDTVIISTSLTEGFVASIFSFPTLDNDPASVEVIYRKGDEIVNKTLRPLEVPIVFEPSKRTVINMPVLNTRYLEKPAFRSGAMIRKSAGIQKIIVQESQF